MVTAVNKRLYSKLFVKNFCLKSKVAIAVLSRTNKTKNPLKHSVSNFVFSIKNFSFLSFYKHTVFICIFYNTRRFKN